VVVVTDGAEPSADTSATEALREQLRAARTGEEPFFDRGPGYARLADGRDFAEVDLR
jgi:N-methylhydantoinase B